MLNAPEREGPQQLRFKGIPTEVYLYTLSLKDSIWLMWENKTERGPHAPDKEPSEADQSAAAFQRKHNHRDRAKETTFQARYRIAVTNMELVDPDEPNGDTWSFSLPAGPNQRVMRRLRKLEHETPGVKYEWKVSSQYKFVVPSQ